MSNQREDWDSYRRDDGTIDLVAAMNGNFPALEPPPQAHAESFLRDLERVYRISSRQAAAIAVTTAYWLVR